MPRRYRHEPPRMRASSLRPSPLRPFARLTCEQTDDQLQPFDLEFGVLEVELCPGHVILQAHVLFCVEQAVEVEVGRPLVLGLQDGLGVVQAHPPDVPGELAVGAREVLRGGAQPPVRRGDLLDERLDCHRHLLRYPCPDPESLMSRTPIVRHGRPRTLWPAIPAGSRPGFWTSRTRVESILKTLKVSGSGYRPS